MNRSSISQWRCSRADDSESDSSESSDRSYGRAERWPCSQCDKDYATKSNLMRHFHATHTTTQTTVTRREERYPCNLCGKDYASQGNLNRHLSTVHGRNGGANIKNEATASSTEITQKSKQETNVNIYNPIITNIYNLRLRD